MRSSRVGIFVEPRLYTDLFRRILQRFETIELIEPPMFTETSTDEDWTQGIDVVVVSLGVSGAPPIESIPVQFQNTKLIALSLDGSQGFLRRPGAQNWEEVHPFGLQNMISEVLAG